MTIKRFTTQAQAIRFSVRYNAQMNVETLVVRQGNSWLVKEAN